MLFRNQRTARRARHPLPRRPVRRALPGRPRPDAAAVGRAGDRGGRRLGPARRRRSASWRRHRDHQPRDPGHRLARPRSAGRWSRWATRRRHRGPRGALGPRPGPADPRRVAGERQAPQRDELRRASSSGSATRRATAGSRTWFWGVQEVPDILDRWGARPAARAGPPGHRAAARRRRPTCCGSGSPGLRPRRPRPRPRGRAGQPVARRARDRAAPPDQPHGQPASLEPADYRPLVRELLAHQTLSRRTRLAAAGAAAGRAPVGRTSCRAAWVAEIERARLRRGRRPRRPASATPTPHAVRRPRPARTSAQVADAAVDAIKALLLENARLRGEEARLRARARRDPPRARARPTCGRRTGPARRPCGGSQRSRAGPRAAAGLPPGAGQELAVGVAADLPGRVAVGAQRRRRRRRPAPGGRRSTASRLPATLVISSEATSAATILVEAGVVGRRGGQRHRRRRELLLLHQALDRRPRRAGRPGSRCGPAGRRGRSRAGGRCRRSSGTGSAPGR